MKIKFTLLFILSFYLSIDISFGQSSYKPGFLINLNGDTLRGEIEYKYNNLNRRPCTFKAGDNITEYLPGQIKGFGIDNEKTFKSNIVKELFVEVLIIGELSLYKYDNIFYMQKRQDSVYKIESKIALVTINGKEGYRETSKWKGIISFLISDCLSDPKYISNILLEERPLTKLTASYNNCKSSDQVIYKKDKAWIKVTLGLQTSLNSNMLKSKDYADTNPYMAKKYNRVSPSIGVCFLFTSPRNFDQFSFVAELNYIKTNFQGNIVRKVNILTYHDDTYINLNTLEIPLLLKYSFPVKNGLFYTQAGLVYDINLKGSAIWRNEFKSGNTVYVSDETAFLVARYLIGYGAGFGVNKTFKSLKTNISLRYTYFPRLNADNNFGVSLSRLGLTVNVFMKKNKE